MKKIGIMTINDNNNYGNRLQNYAVQEILKKIGVDPYTIENYPQYNSKKHFLVNRILNINFSRNYSKNHARSELFKNFNKKIQYYNGIYCPFKKYKDLEYIICGSDQVWNPFWGKNDATLLKYIDAEKRIAFAASFGESKIPEESKNEYAKELKKFRYLSVREDDGAKIVKELIDRDATILLDPTMMLSVTEWQKIEKRPIALHDSQKYILAYFLSTPSPRAVNLIKKLSKDYKIIEINNEDYGFSVNVGPQEFLFLFDNSELILTDSFHGCVFSILYDKPFLVYDRMLQSENMNSRIITLLKKMGMMRKYEGANLYNDIWEHDYEEAAIILEKEKINSISFLKKSMNLS